MTAPVKPTTLHRLLGQFHFGVTLAAVAISALTVFLAGIAALHGYAERNLALSSQLGAYSVEPALVFNDPVAAREAIAPLTILPGIARVTVGDSGGRNLVDWKRPSADPAPLVTRLFFDQPVDTVIVRNGAPVGTIRLWGDAAALADYVWAALIGAFACLLITAIGTFVIARRFERTITGHIAAIADVAHDVRLHRRLDRRVATLPVAELNRLGKDMNALLDELADWQRSEADQRAVLARRAHIDPLTGLPNRAALDTHLADRLIIKDGVRPDFALLYFDIDRFKRANDQFGHAGGDAVLKAVAQRMAAALQPGDLAARLGGDEFVIVTAQGRSGPIADQFAATLAHAFAEPVAMGSGIDLIPSISIGIAHYPRDGLSAAALLNAADMAMYRAKQAQHDRAR